MTAYGRAEHLHDDKIFVCEIKTVNNRYRDIIVRMPKTYQVLEKDIRTALTSRIRRGRVEVAIQVDQGGEEPADQLELNEPLVGSYMKIIHQLSEKTGLGPGIRLDTLCQMKDVILAKSEDVDLERVRSGFEAVLDQTLDTLDQMRRREGEAIEADFIQRLDLLEHYVDTVQKQTPRLVEEYRDRLHESIKNISQGVIVDENRVAAEAAFFAERSDVTEELVRIRSHIKQFHAYLSMDDAVGRRLDFLLQEMNREVNTLASKSSNSDIAKWVVEMKAELEKLREQAQNVE